MGVSWFYNTMDTGISAAVRSILFLTSFLVRADQEKGYSNPAETAYFASSMQTPSVVLRA